MDNSLLPQHKRLAMGMSVNKSTDSKNMTNDDLAPHKPYGIHKNTTEKNDSPPKSGLSSFNPKK
jgi:hypothetical protein